jgi:hypothetical protein
MRSLLVAMVLAVGIRGEVRLNNLVVELSREPGAFTLASDGWVYVSARRDLKGDDRIFVSFDNETDDRRGLVLTARSPFGERQNYLAAGRHTISAHAVGGAKLSSFVLRQVPETTFSKFGATPRTLSAGDHDWDFLAKYILLNINTIVGLNNETQLSYVRQWRSRGGRWFAEVSRTGNPEALLKTVGMTNPHFDGVFMDEFQKDTAGMDLWSGRIESDKDIRFYFADDQWLGSPFVQKQLSAGRKIVWEKYLGETDPLRLGEWMAGIKKENPGVVTNSTLCLAFSSAPYLTVNRSPEIDFKVWMDRQFHEVATHPAFVGLYGLMEYQSRTVDEETFRWAALLFRHYAIEGKTNLLSDEYGFTYALNHILNPDFREAGKNWTIKGQVDFETFPKLAQYQGRFHYSNYWDTCAVVTGPATLSQKVRNLKPGRQYSAKLISIRKDDLINGKSEAAYHPVRLNLEGATVLPERGSRDLIATPASGGKPPWTGEHPLWIDYQQMVFYADAAEADLRINVTQGPTLLINFIEVQPYLAR